MDGKAFDEAIRRLTTRISRRGLWRPATGAALGTAVAGVSAMAEAKKKRTRKKPQQNAFGCLNVGQKCRGNSGLCCSGICQGRKPKQGKKDKSQCAAHDTSTCQVGQKSTGCGGEDIECITTTGREGECQTTTGNGAYCLGLAVPAECSRDSDCQAAFGPLAACLVCAASGTGTLCAGPG